MKSFEPGVLERQVFPASLVATVRRLADCRHRLALASERLATGRLAERLRESASVASLEAATRLDGAVVPADRLREIACGREPDNRAEQLAAGYHGALAAIGREAAPVDFSPHAVLRLHEQLCRFTPEGGGSWKISDDLVTETQPDGSTAVIFTPVPAYAVDDAMGRLHQAFCARWANAEIDHLLLLPAYVLDFLAIHPFSDGSEAMGRLLTRLLLERAGYGIGAWVSLERVLEESTAAGSAALQASWRGWHEGKHAIAPWTGYLLGIVLEAYTRLEREVETLAPPRGAKRDRVAGAIDRLPAEFRYADLERLVPSVSRPTINRALRRLRADRVVRCVRPGRNARWIRLS